MLQAARSAEVEKKEHCLGGNIFDEKHIYLAISNKKKTVIFFL